MKEAESKSMLSALESTLNHYAVEDSREEKKKLIVAHYIFLENVNHCIFNKAPDTGYV